ncbi:tyrosinase family protein [Gilvibacter sp.]|uniref:tyrosinase family protein n=1 Tax=Gilvibacter sp. TaxID=2729997 RepID=UPI003F49F585
MSPSWRCIIGIGPKSNFIPEHYWGEDNPLNNITRLVSATDEIPKDFINVGAAFRAEKYKTFGGYPAIKKRGDSQLDGIAEQSFHNNIHNWIGGQMATFTESGFDPIFYGHHGNCDRIWEAWQNYSDKNVLPTEEEWLDKRLYATDGNGRPVDFKIKELLNTEDLGYRFNDLDLNPTFCNPYMEADKPKREASKRDCVVPLNLRTSDGADIYAEMEDKERTHVILHFERAQLPYQPYCARVFFEYDKEGEKQSKYTGTFTILPILDLDTVLLQNGVHLQIEIERELAEAIDAQKNIEVIFQPVPLPNRNIPDEILKLENISLVTHYENK